MGKLSIVKGEERLEDKDRVVWFLLCGSEKNKYTEEGMPIFPPLPTTEKMREYQDLWSGQWKRSDGGPGDMVRKV